MTIPGHFPICSVLMVRPVRASRILGYDALVRVRRVAAARSFICENQFLPKPPMLHLDDLRWMIS